jgi:hypothetical protein
MHLTKTYPDFLGLIHEDLDNIVLTTLKSINIEDYRVFILICLKPVTLYIDLVENEYLGNKSKELDTIGMYLFFESIYTTVSIQEKYYQLAQGIKRIIISFKKEHSEATFPFIFVANRFYKSICRYTHYHELHGKFEYMLLTTDKACREIPKE